MLAGIAAAQAAGFAPLKLNCVVQRGVNEDEVLPLVERFRGTRPRAALHRVHGRRHLQRLARASACVPSAELRDRIARALAAAAAGPATIAAKSPRATPSPTARGEIGFVSSVSAPFCGDCHRARVSADGQLYTCLFAGEGRDLRAGAARRARTRWPSASPALWSRRGDRYSEMRGERATASRRHVEMYLVGG